MPTVAGIIIGNEILTGKFPDENGPFLIRRLRALGADLKRLVTIPDDRDEIAREVRYCAEHYDVVFTSGGVGPTHDDVTLESVGQAFDLSMEQRQELLELLHRFKLPKNDSVLRMAQVPEGTELIEHATLSYPVVCCRNVYVFPGVPRLFRIKFEAIADRFAGPKVSCARVYTDERETEIAERLGQIQDRFPAVDIGSYPRLGESEFRVIVTLESRDTEALGLAKQAVQETLSVVEPTGT